MTSPVSADLAAIYLDQVLKPLGTALRHYMPVHRAEAIEAMRKVIEADRRAMTPHPQELESRKCP